MKHTIITIVLFAFIVSADAKKVIHWPDVTQEAAKVQRDLFLHTKADIDNHSVVFTGLPKNAIAIRIIDAKGIVRISGSISRTNNTVNTAQLPMGCYTVVLNQGSQAKMFGFFTDIIIKQGSYPPAG